MQLNRNTIRAKIANEQEADKIKAQQNRNNEPNIGCDCEPMVSYGIVVHLNKFSLWMQLALCCLHCAFIRFQVFAFAQKPTWKIKRHENWRQTARSLRCFIQSLYRRQNAFNAFSLRPYFFPKMTIKLVYRVPMTYFAFTRVNWSTAQSDSTVRQMIHRLIILINDIRITFP